MRTRLTTGLVVTATAGLLASSALAAPTETTIADVTRTGTTVVASGTAAFDGSAPATSVGGTNTEFAQPAVAAAAGVDLKDGLIEPLPEGKGLRFTWKVASLPAQVPPEVARYTWAFAVGGKEYQLQAKRTNMGATTVADDIPGHVAALSRNGFFQVGAGALPAATAPVPAVTAASEHRASRARTVAGRRGMQTSGGSRAHRPAPHGSASDPAFLHRR